MGGSAAADAKDRAYSRTCGPLFQGLCQKYDNLSEVDKLAAVAQKVDAVKVVMQENVNTALANCVKLESIEQATGEYHLQLFVESYLYCYFECMTIYFIYPFFSTIF